MLKKSTILALILIYSFSTFGAGLNTFYCCGKLKSISLSFGIEQNKSIEKSNSGDGCCKIQHYNFKGKEKHYSLKSLNPPTFDSKILETALSNNHVIDFSFKKTRSINGSNAPPFYKQLPLFITNRVFRI